MSKQIELKYECPACLKMVPETTLKPKAFQGSVFISQCNGCKTNTVLRVTRKFGHPGQVNYQYVEIMPSEVGAKLIDDRVKEILKTTKPPTAEL